MTLRSKRGLRPEVYDPDTDLKIISSIRDTPKHVQHISVRIGTRFAFGFDVVYKLDTEIKTASYSAPIQTILKEFNQNRDMFAIFKSEEDFLVRLREELECLLVDVIKGFPEWHTIVDLV